MARGVVVESRLDERHFSSSPTPTPSLSPSIDVDWNPMNARAFASTTTGNEFDVTRKRKVTRRAMSRAMCATRRDVVVASSVVVFLASALARARARTTTTTEDEPKATTTTTTEEKRTTTEEETRRGGNMRNAIDRERRGMERFAANDVESAIEDFDAVIARDRSRATRMWQRGIAKYYVDAFADGAEQFRADVEANANDTEEAVWAFLCDARDEEKGVAYAREHLVAIGRDSRRVMSSVYGLFAGRNDEEALREAGKFGASDEFYSALYLGLWFEANGDAVKAKREILRANSTVYAKLSGDYMADVARVHALRRGWT